MSPTEALQQIITSLSNSSESARNCLIVCPDQIRQSRVLARIEQSLSKNIERTTIDGSVLNEEMLKKIFFSQQNTSLFSRESLLIIRSVDQLSAHLAKILTENLKEIGSSVVVIATAKKLASNLALYKYFEQAKRIFILNELTGADLEKWIVRELTQIGIRSYPPETPRMISQASSDSPDQALALIEKLSLYIDGDSVTAEELKRMVPVEGHVDEFEFIAQIASLPVAQRELKIAQLLEQGVSPFPLLGLLFKNYSSYHALHSLLRSNLSPEECARRVGMPPWLVKKVTPIVKRYTLPQLEESIAAIARADSLLKNRSLGDHPILSELTETLAP